MEPYKPHRMGDHSDSWGCSGDDDPCYCTKPKEVSLQKESEWELFENIQGSVYAAFFSEAGEDDFEEFDNWRKNVLPGIVSKSIATAVSNREKEIADEVIAMIDASPLIHGLHFDSECETCNRNAVSVQIMKKRLSSKR